MVKRYKKPAQAKAPNPQASWIGPNPQRDESISKLIATWKSQKLSKKKSKLSQEEKEFLMRQFKDAAQGQSPAIRFMHAILKAAGIVDAAAYTEKAPIKNWERAAEKMKNAGRNTRDIGRGRIYFDSQKEYQAIMKVLASTTKQGVVRGVREEKGIIVPGSLDNYLENPRKSGYAGAVHFDIEVELGKNRTGFFEVQVMPRAYIDTDKKSHPLFDLIRILQEDVAPAYRTKEDKKVIKALLIANSCLFLEEGMRTGYIDLRKDKPPKISQADLEMVNDVLDRIRTSIESLEGRNYAWKKELLESTTYAKTSVLNIFLGQSNAAKISKNSQLNR